MKPGAGRGHVVTTSSETVSRWSHATIRGAFCDLSRPPCPFPVRARSPQPPYDTPWVTPPSACCGSGLGFLGPPATDGPVPPQHRHRGASQQGSQQRPGGTPGNV